MSSFGRKGEGRELLVVFALRDVTYVGSYLGTTRVGSPAAEATGVCAGGGECARGADCLL